MDEDVTGKNKSNKSRKRMAALAIAVVAIVLVASVAVILQGSKPENKPGDIAPATIVDLNQTSIAIPLSSITQKATWFNYSMSGATVRFFAVKDVDGTVHTAFDECWMCYGSRLGYSQNGTNMLENCCNMDFPITSITAAGCTGMDCHPIYLPSSVVGNNLVIEKSELAKERLVFLTNDEQAPVHAVNTTNVQIPLSSISQSATWYQYEVSGSFVRFFAVKDSNGTIHTAFDECPMCYAAHLGFRQNGTDMVENCCNMAFPIANITKEGYMGMGCRPIFLPSTIVGDQLVIKTLNLTQQRLVFLTEDETAQVVSYNSTSVAIPLGSVSAKATWYQYEVSGTHVRFFAVTDADGAVHTALDICTKCQKAHAGFRQQGNATVMIENCCSMTFPIANITAVGCSGMMCHPTYLANQVIGNQVVMSIADLAAGASMFPA